MSTERQQLLDGLDRRMALGEVDLSTYQMLRAKFLATETAQDEDKIGNAVSQLPKEVQALRCRGCGAPLTLDPAKEQVIVECTHCGATLTLTAAKDEVERLRQDIRKFMVDMVGELGGRGTIDEASRRYIFKEKLLPSLRLAADRATETFSMVRHSALFSFPLVNELPGSAFITALQSMPDSARLAESVRLTEARTSSPEILAFAVSEADRASLLSIQAQCQETVRLAATRQHAFTFDLDGATKSLANLGTLKAVYEQIGSASLNQDARCAFAKGMESRIEALESATMQLRSLLQVRDGYFTDSVLSALDIAAQCCESAAAQIESSGVEAREAVPAAEGARVDAKTIRVLRDTVQLFSDCGSAEGVEFKEFVQSLSRLKQRARKTDAGLDWISAFMARLSQHVAAKRGEPSVSIVSGFAASEQEAKSAARSGMFAGPETVNIKGRLMVPFWVAELTASQQTGVIFKKGHAVREIVLVDASAHSGRHVMASSDSALFRDALEAIRTQRAFQSDAEPLVPIVDAEGAAAALRRLTSAKPGYAGGRPNILGLVYLPAVTAEFANKKSMRSSTFLAGAGNQFADLVANAIQLGTLHAQIA